MSPSVPVIRQEILATRLWLVDTRGEIFGDDPWRLEEGWDLEKHLDFLFLPVVRPLFARRSANLLMQSQEPVTSTNSWGESIGEESQSEEPVNPGVLVAGKDQNTNTYVVECVTHIEEIWCIGSFWRHRCCR